MEGCLLAVLILIFIAVIVAAIYSSTKASEPISLRLLREQEAAGRAQEDARRAQEEAARQRDVAEQMQFKEQLLKMNEESLSALEAMGVRLESAENYLDRAEGDFSEGAFAPFWDSVERAAVALGGFDERVQIIDKNSSTYIDLVKKYRGRAPVFAVSRDSMPKLKIASETSKRMNGIVRKAQRDFQFATIYEQRKTNQILVAGFRHLAQALEEMTWRITSSVDNLTSSVDRMSSALNDSLQRIHEQTEKIAADTAGHRADAAKEASGRSERAQKALEMLDNIQRKRYPSFLHGGLR